MELTKMKRCKKAAHGFKGKFTSASLFSDIEQIKSLVGDEHRMVINEKWPGVEQPAWFLELSASHSKWGAGAGAINYVLYVNDDQVAAILSLVKP